MNWVTVTPSIEDRFIELKKLIKKPVSTRRLKNAALKTLGICESPELPAGREDTEAVLAVFLSYLLP